MSSNNNASFSVPGASSSASSGASSNKNASFSSAGASAIKSPGAMKASPSKTEKKSESLLSRMSSKDLSKKGDSSQPAAKPKPFDFKGVSVIDWEEAMQQCGDDDEFLRELLADLRDETDSQMNRMEEIVNVRSLLS